MAPSLTILAIRDDAQRQRISVRLNRLGYFVMAVPNAHEGLGLITRNRPRVVVLDPDLPDMKSTEVCRRARVSLGDRAPLIYYAGNCSIDDFEELLDAGADDILVRAGSMESLIDRVKYWSTGSRRRLPEKVRRLMLIALQDARPVAELAAAGNLSSETDPGVARISGFLRRARKVASPNFGRTVAQKLALLGYTVGVVEFCSRKDFKIKICFNDYLRAVLMETEVLSAAEVDQMVASWDELINANQFRGASERAGMEYTRAEVEGDEFRPIYLAAFEQGQKSAA